MNPRIAEAHPAPLMPFPANTRLSHVAAVNLEARRVRDAMLAAAVRDLFAGAVTRVMAWRERRLALAQLRALTDRELADIGLTRGMLRGALETAREPVPAAVTPAPVAANDITAARSAA